MLPDSQLPSHRFELWCKATTVQNQAIALTHARLSFPRAQATVGCCGLPRKKDGEGERSAPGLTSQLLAPRFLRFLRGSMPARCSYSRPSTTCATARRSPSASSRPALPGSVEPRGRAPEPRGRTRFPGATRPPSGPARKVGSGRPGRRFSRSRPGLGAAVAPGSAYRGRGDYEGLLWAAGGSAAPSQAVARRRGDLRSPLRWVAGPDDPGRLGSPGLAGKACRAPGAPLGAGLCCHRTSALARGEPGFQGPGRRSRGGTPGRHAPLVKRSCP